MSLQKLLDLLLKDNIIGTYTYCEIIQILLLSKNGKAALNYFTHITCSSSFKATEAESYLTSKPITISKNFKLCITKKIIPVCEFIPIFLAAANTDQWVYDHKVIDLNQPLNAGAKFIPEIDPTSSKYRQFVPLEWYLYGSNFHGNYYIVELYRRNDEFLSKLSSNQIAFIQRYMEAAGLFYKLSDLQDRIGNIVCKIPVETLGITPVQINERGILLNCNRSSYLSDRKLLKIAEQRNDGLIYYLDSSFIESNPFQIKLSANQMINTITVLDFNTSLPLYSAVFNFTQHYGNFSHITPPLICGRPGCEREFVDSNQNLIKIDLDTHTYHGDIIEFIEDVDAIKRQTRLEEAWMQRYGYLKVYKSKSHAQAIQDIRNILNNNILFDLEEICVIDPYLTANDLIDTVLFCKKHNIKVRALTSYKKIHRKSAVGNINDFLNFKQAQSDILSHSIAKATDVKLEFRTIRGNHGFAFHDRFIIMRYKINRDRVWALGTSINSIGNKHSILHIVSIPETVTSIFDELWQLTEHDDCLIYKSH